MTVEANIGKRTKIWHPDLVNIYGCSIGEDCIIGALVTKNINSKGVYVGVPARYIKDVERMK